ncbi:hypothetical protein OKW21_001337 [Catalinimonas alkaloidigena]|uniref:hypothetical protein n=1 Tax=Catalinimonas alkaloidigena TaxID=1075417 RepID=UPI002405C2D1|nr:hypothetical protein [Catalinimonas alkaloidigena]MDF9796074.1 hypothetical protein [Catalinimonas alkaloidigena]
MPTLSVSIDRGTEKKFEILLNEYGYEFSKHYNHHGSDDEDEVFFVLTSDDEFDLVELGILNEYARQSQKLEDIEMENYRRIATDKKSGPVKDKSLIKSYKHAN